MLREGLVFGICPPLTSALLGGESEDHHSPRARRDAFERLSRLAFVTPAIVEAICQGQQPAELSTETLLNRIDLPLEWTAQRNALGIK